MSHELNQEMFSKQLFGRQHRLNVWEAILQATEEEPHIFRQIDIMMSLARSKDIVTSATQRELNTLKKLEMIEPALEEHETVTHYRRTGSPIWRIAELAVMTMRELPSDTALENSP